MRPNPKIRKELGFSYTKEVMLPLNRFDRRSLRWVRSPADPRRPLGAYLLVGCLRGKWRPGRPKGQQCSVGMKTHVILKPKRTRIAANPYTLLTATLGANPPDKFRGLLPKARRLFREVHGAKATITGQVVNIPGIKDGEVAVYQGDLEGIAYRNSHVQGSTKRDHTWVHNKGDRAHSKVLRPGRIFTLASNPKVQLIVFKRKPLIKGFYDGS